MHWADLIIFALYGLSIAVIYHYNGKTGGSGMKHSNWQSTIQRGKLVVAFLPEYRKDAVDLEFVCSSVNMVIFLLVCKLEKREIITIKHTHTHTHLL